MSTTPPDRSRDPRFIVSRAISKFVSSRTFRGTGRLRDFGRRLLPPASGPVVVPTIHGFRMLVDPSVDKGVESAIYIDGVYEAGTLHVILACLRPGDVFFDVGGNVGQMTVAASRAVGPTGRVHSFEPVPETRRLLNENLALNAASNVRVHPVALGSAPAKGTIYENLEVNRGSASLIEPDAGAAGHEIEIDTLDALVAREGVGTIRMLKADVEGWELEVLRGGKETLSRPDAPILCVEYSNLHPVQGGEPIDLFRFAASVNDYGVYRLTKSKNYASPLYRVAKEADMQTEGRINDNIFCMTPAHVASLPKSLFV